MHRAGRQPPGASESRGDFLGVCAAEGSAPLPPRNRKGIAYRTVRSAGSVRRPAQTSRGGCVGSPRRAASGLAAGHAWDTTAGPPLLTPSPPPGLKHSPLAAPLQRHQGAIRQSPLLAAMRERAQPPPLDQPPPSAEAAPELHPGEGCPVPPAAVPAAGPTPSTPAPGARGVPPSAEPSRSGGQAEIADWGTGCPALLRRLQNFLDDELTLLDSTAPHRRHDLSNRPVAGLWRRPAPVTPARCRVFIDALRHFAGHSRIYGEVLGAVSREFAALVQDHARLAEACANAALGDDRLRREHMVRLSALEQRHAEERAALEQEKAELRQELQDLSAEHEEALRSLREMQRVEKTCTDKYAEEHEKVLTMVNLMRDADEQHQETTERVRKLDEERRRAEDWAKHYQEKAEKAEEKLRGFKDVRPVSEFEELMRKYNDRLETILENKNTMAKLRADKEKAEKVTRKAIRERNEFEADMRRMRAENRTDTPRPDWRSLLREVDLTLEIADKSSQAVGGMILERFANEREACGTLSREVEKLKTKLGFLQDAEDDEEDKPDGDGEPEFFVGLGTGKDVPRYLRWFGQVINRRMPKREVEQFISDFWAARKKEWDRFAKARGLPANTLPGTTVPPLPAGGPASPRQDSTVASQLSPLSPAGRRVSVMAEGFVKAAQGGGKGVQAIRGAARGVLWPSIADFLYDLLKNKHGVQAKIVDKAYNVKHAVRKYSFDSDCELFMLILEGQLPEAVYFEQKAMLERLQKGVEMLEIPGPTGKRKKIVKKAKLLSFLDRFFPAKTEKSIVRLKYCLSKQFPGDDVNVAQLFAEDREGNQTPFIEGVRNQMVREALEYVQELSGAILERADFPEDGEDISLPLTAVRDAVLHVDPKKPPADLARLINLGLGVPESTGIEWDRPVDLAAFLAQMKQGYICRHTRPEDCEAARREQELERAPPDEEGSDQTG